MGKIKIYMKLVDGVMHYRDNEQDHGTAITTKVDPGDTIIWKKDRNSGIKQIKRLIISGPDDFLTGKPKKGILSDWKASVSRDAKGEISYKPVINDTTIEAEFKAAGEPLAVKSEPEVPILRIKK